MSKPPGMDIVFGCAIEVISRKGCYTYLNRLQGMVVNVNADYVTVMFPGMMTNRLIHRSCVVRCDANILDVLVTCAS